MQDFPGGPVVKNPPANAGDTGSIPSPGKFHVSGQLGPYATTTEPKRLEPVVHKRSHSNKAMPCS